MKREWFTEPYESYYKGLMKPMSIKQLKFRTGKQKSRWPDIICTQCTHYLNVNECKYCIRFANRKDKWEKWK